MSATPGTNMLARAQNLAKELSKVTSDSSSPDLRPQHKSYSVASPLSPTAASPIRPPVSRSPSPYVPTFSSQTASRSPLSPTAASPIRPPLSRSASPYTPTPIALRECSTPKSLSPSGDPSSPNIFSPIPSSLVSPSSHVHLAECLPGYKKSLPVRSLIQDSPSNEVYNSPFYQKLYYFSCK